LNDRAAYHRGRRGEGQRPFLMVSNAAIMAWVLGDFGVVVICLPQAFSCQHDFRGLDHMPATLNMTKAAFTVAVNPLEWVGHLADN